MRVLEMVGEAVGVRVDAVPPPLPPRVAVIEGVAVGVTVGDTVGVAVVPGVKAHMFPESKQVEPGSRVTPLGGTNAHVLFAM